MSQLEMPALVLETARDQQIWDQGHEQGWNDCLHEWQEQDKLHSTQYHLTRLWRLHPFVGLALTLSLTVWFLVGAAIYVWPYLP
jgi:hypothetical protein